MSNGGPTGDSFAFVHGNLSENTIGSGLEFHDRFIIFKFKENLPLFDRISFRFTPASQRPFSHGQAEFRHDDFHYITLHIYSNLPSNN